MNDLRSQVFLFGPFRLDAGQRMLWRNGEHLPLTPKEFETLLALVEAGGQSVGKDAILSRVWPDTFVSESSLTRNISVLRKALGDEVIQTLPKFGYRLALEVSELAPASQAPAELGADDGPAQPPGAERAPSAFTGVASTDATTPSGAGRWPGAHPRSPASATALRLASPAGVALLVLIAGGGFAVYREAGRLRAKPHSSAQPIRIAVLPFANLTGDARQEYVCDGLTEAMIAEVSRLSPGRLDVIARTSAMQYKHGNKSVPEIGRELKVDYILESSLRESGERIRVTSQLVRAGDAGHVWTGEYDRDLKDVLTAQQEMAIAIAGEIALSLSPASTARSRSSVSVDPDAYREYLLGRFYWNQRNRSGLLQSIVHFQLAIARDPHYARAYAGLADAYLVLGGGYLPDKETYGKGRDAALKAIDLDPALAEAYCSLGYEKYINERDWSGADEDYQRALRLDPEYATAHHWYALYLSAMLRTGEAVREIHRALDLDPLSVPINYGAGAVFIQAGRYDDAIAQLQRALEIDPTNAVTHGTLAVAYERKGRYDDSVREFETAQRLQGGYSPYAIELVHVYALAGQTAKARADLRRLLNDSAWAQVSPLSFARAYAALGETEEAFRWLERSIDDHSCTAAEINTDRGLDPLRPDPRFSQIRRQFHLPNQ